MKRYFFLCFLLLFFASASSEPAHWLTVDLGKTADLSGFVLEHAGVRENKSWNASAYIVEAVVDGKWVTVLKVRNNTESVAVHGLDEPVQTRFVRLRYLQSEQEKDRAARVYSFKILNNQADNVALHAKGALIVDESSSANPQETGVNAIDGDSSTKWCSVRKTEVPRRVPAGSSGMNFARIVDPFTGTGGGGWSAGNTYPGAVVPWGMVSVSPHNTLRGANAYTKRMPPVIFGFGHTHVSGSAVGGYGHPVLLPLSRPAKAGEIEQTQIENEKAHAGYYSTTLPEEKIEVELTAALRAGISRYRFSEGKSAHVLLDGTMIQSGVIVSAELRVLSRTKAQGEISAEANGKYPYKFYYAVEFNLPAQKIKRRETNPDGPRPIP